MSDFIDLYLDDYFSTAPWNSSPRFSTTITSASSGAENRNRNWAHPLRRFSLPEAIREQDTFEAVHDHWLITGGPEKTFPLRDPLDFATIGLEAPNVEPDTSGLDQGFGTGDGFVRGFQLIKTYERGGETYARPIYLPVLDSVDILMADPSLGNPMAPTAPGSVGVLHGGPYTYSISRPGGIVTFSPAPQSGLVLTWGGFFDCQVRFEADDSFDGIVQSYQVSGFAALTFIETRPC